MIGFFRSNGSIDNGVAISSLILFFLILLLFSLPAMGIPSRPLETKYSRQDLFNEKFFLNIDDGLITLIARNNPLGSVMDEIGRRTGIKVKVSPGLRQKKIILSWKDIPFEEGVKKFAEDSGLSFKKDEEGNFCLSEQNAFPETEGLTFKKQEKRYPPTALKNNTQEISGDIGPADSVLSGKAVSQNKDTGNSILLNEMVIRFKQGISEEEINKFLSDANIKVKKYIAALHYHILSLPEGMTSYDAMALLKSKKMLYQAEPKYLVPVK